MNAERSRGCRMQGLSWLWTGRGPRRLRRSSTTKPERQRSLSFSPEIAKDTSAIDIGTQGPQRWSGWDHPIKLLSYCTVLTKTAVVRAGTVALPCCELRLDWRVIGSFDCCCTGCSESARP